MHHTILASILAAQVLALPTTTFADESADRGKTVFSRCVACHTATNQNKVGPYLAGVVGRKAGSAEGYKYSPAMTASTIVWDEQPLDAFLAGPSKLVPGTKMVIAVPKEDDRRDVIAYLKSLSGN